MALPAPAQPPALAPGAHGAPRNPRPAEGLPGKPCAQQTLSPPPRQKRSLEEPGPVCSQSPGSRFLWRERAHTSQLSLEGQPGWTARGQSRTRHPASVLPGSAPI